jgi:hypothetical protein
MLLFFEKWIFPTMSETTEFGKKTRGILGVKMDMTLGLSIVRSFCGVNSV